MQWVAVMVEIQVANGFSDASATFFVWFVWISESLTKKFKRNTVQG